MTCTAAVLFGIALAPAPLALATAVDPHAAHTAPAGAATGHEGHGVSGSSSGAEQVGAHPADRPGGSPDGSAGLKSSFPPDGARLAAAPRVLRLEFPHPMSLEALSLAAPTGERVPLVFAKAPASVIQIPLPSLIPDDYTAAWRATAPDGHEMAGSFSFTVGD